MIFRSTFGYSAYGISDLPRFEQQRQRAHCDVRLNYRQGEIVDVFELASPVAEVDLRGDLEAPLCFHAARFRRMSQYSRKFAEISKFDHGAPRE